MDKSEREAVCVNESAYLVRMSGLFLAYANEWLDQSIEGVEATHQLMKIAFEMENRIKSLKSKRPKRTLEKKTGNRQKDK